MSFLQITYFAKALMRQTTFHMYLPNDIPQEAKAENRNFDRPTKALYLLHGFSGNTINWVNGSLAQEWSDAYNLAIVMPSGDNSFYIDARGTGHAYETFIGEDLVAYVTKTFGLSAKKEDTFIGGLSMGGYGAIHTGLLHPERFGKVFGLSSALIIHDIAGMKPGTKNDIADYDYYEGIFGDLEKIEESEHNPEYLVKKLKAEGKEIPPIFMACGTEDFLLKNNRDFRDFLVSEKVDLTYKESAGIHEWKFWNEYLEPAIRWLLDLGEAGSCQ